MVKHLHQDAESLSDVVKWWGRMGDKAVLVKGGLSWMRIVPVRWGTTRRNKCCRRVGVVEATRPCRFGKVDVRMYMIMTCDKRTHMVLEPSSKGQRLSSLTP